MNPVENNNLLISDLQKPIRSILGKQNDDLVIPSLAPRCLPNM
jgi:hypothetical protein